MSLAPTGSFYDPISAGSSRRSSQLSTNGVAPPGPPCPPNNTTTSLPPAPPSHLLAGHLQRLQQQQPTPVPNNSNLIVQPQQSCTTWLSVTTPTPAAAATPDNGSRRMSEPCHGMVRDRVATPPPPRPSSVQLSPIKTPGEHHPNQEVVLDEVISIIIIISLFTELLLCSSILLEACSFPTVSSLHSYPILHRFSLHLVFSAESFN